MAKNSAIAKCGNFVKQRAVILKIIVQLRKTEWIDKIYRVEETKVERAR